MSMTNELVLVTGAGGFIGGHLVDRLRREGRRVRAVDVKPLVDWYQTFGDSLQITPTVRYYSQGGADFYVPYLKKPGDPAKKFLQPDAFSSDYRLSPYGSLSFGAKAEYVFHTPWWRDIEWRGRASVERYLSSGDLCLTSVSVPAPGLVSFTVFSLGLTVVF